MLEDLPFIGWQMTCTMYCVKIEEIFDAMIHLAYKVLPENLKVVDRYIQSVWKTVTVFVQSIKREEGTEMLRSRFELHVTSEEARLRQNLESMKYRIDTSDTYQVVGGDGRLETVSTALGCCFLDDHDTSPRPDPLPYVLSYLEERSGKDQPWSETCPF